jgi:hypothetical protein
MLELCRLQLSEKGVDETLYCLLKEIYHGKDSFSTESYAGEGFQEKAESIKRLMEDGYINASPQSTVNYRGQDVYVGFHSVKLRDRGRAIVTGEGAQVREAHLARRKILGLLWKHYNSVGRGRLITTDELAQRTELEHEAAEAAIRFLMDSGFAEYRFVSENKTEITIQGIAEYERMIVNPDSVSPGFSLKQTFNAPVGNVQTGDYNQATVNQDMRSERLVAVFERLTQSIVDLPDEHQQDATEAIEVLKEESTKNAPRKAIVTAILNQLETWGSRAANSIEFLANLATIAQVFGLKWPNS